MNPKKIYLTDELVFFLDKIKSNDPFSLLRYGDGERAIMTGKAVKAQEGWESKEEMSELSYELLESINIYDDNVYYGISCPCCDSEAYYWYISRIKSKNITFANLFVNSNYEKFIDEFSKLNQDAIVIANKEGQNNKIGNLNILKYYSISDNLFEEYSKLDLIINDIKENYGTRKNILYVISAGPLANILIKRLYSFNRDNFYIDFGSSIDKYTHGVNKRPYANRIEPYSSMNCWMYKRNTINLNISVVLTSYKKPESLEAQIKAIKNQNLKPCEIMLFQDYINENYNITFKNNLIKEFDKTLICNSNKGVWGRFEWAKQAAKCNLICVFDDDTIPGERWLENCFSNYIEKPGIYVTNGIILLDENYPKNYICVGWKHQNNKTIMVDFGGHSWFFDKKNLDFMFTNITHEIRKKYKYCGEDMCLSFASAINNISTYVPPHPINNIKLWGSLPDFGYKYGDCPQALFHSSEASKQYNDVYKEIRKLLYTPLYIKYKNYCNAIDDCFEKSINKNIIFRILKKIKLKIKVILRK